MDKLTIQTLEVGLDHSARKLETATFGMGCFWGPEARFGSLPGVVRTRVGFAGGTTVNPTYRNMGDHTETVEIDFDPAILSYGEVLLHFWRNHYPNRDNYKGRQYISLLRYHDEEQKAAIESVKKEMEKELGEPIETEIAPFDGFTLAEERHQKYYLKRYPKALAQLKELYPLPELLVDSTFAARLNGFVKGYGTREGLKREIAEWPINENCREMLIRTLFHMKW
jgi:peptide-methionine (S)-S-oxide reductase